MSALISEHQITTERYPDNLVMFEEEVPLPSWAAFVGSYRDSKDELMGLMTLPKQCTDSGKMIGRRDRQ